MVCSGYLAKPALIRINPNKHLVPRSVNNIQFRGPIFRSMSLFVGYNVPHFALLMPN